MLQVTIHEAGAGETAVVTFLSKDTEALGGSDVGFYDQVEASHHWQKNRIGQGDEAENALIFNDDGSFNVQNPNVKSLDWSLRVRLPFLD